MHVLVFQRPQHTVSLSLVPPAAGVLSMCVGWCFGGRRCSPACWTRTPFFLGFRQWFTIGVVIHSLIGVGAVQVIVMDPVTGQPQTVMVPADQLGTLGTLQAGPPQPAILQPGGPVSLPGQHDGMMLQQQPVQPLTMQPVAPAAVPQQQPVQQQPQQMQAAPPVQQQQQPSGGANAAGELLAGQDPQQMQTLLRQVMTMSDEQINGLPAEFKQQVLYVKEQIRLGHVRIE
jgi:hypothetical protein